MSCLLKGILITVLGSVISACSSVKVVELSDVDASLLRGKSIAIVKYEDKPHFIATTPINAQFGLLGVTTAIANGNSIIKNNNIVDPSITISEKLALDFEEHYGATVAASDVLSDGHKVDHLVEAYSDYDYILDVRGLGWGAVFYRASLTRYKVFFNASVRLIDRKSKKIITQTSCGAGSAHEHFSLAPTYQQLEAGVKLKKELAAIVESCTRFVRESAKIKHIYPAVVESVLSAEDEGLSPLFKRLRDSHDYELVELARKYYVKESISQDDQDLFAQKIWQLRYTEERRPLDAAAWFCKVLGKNKNPRYKQLLELISKEAAAKKLKKHAVKALKSLSSDEVMQYLPSDT